MKTTPLQNSKFDQPAYIFGGWHVTQWPPVGEERVHGPYPTREAARRARAEMTATTGSDRHAAERAFRRA
jgi:hypothetical protein